MDAPIEVIQAAYRTLSKKYHPDKNPNNPEAERIMRIINTAYEVLSDPDKRQEHDSWIAKENWRLKKEAMAADKARREAEVQTSHAPAVEPRQSSGTAKKNVKRAEVKKSQLVSFIKWIGTRLAVLVIIIVIFHLLSEKSTVPNEVSHSDSTASENVVPDMKLPVAVSNCAGKQTFRPDGKAWSAYPQVMTVRERRAGLSSLLLDNSRNNQDLYVKLARSRDKGSSNFARDAFIPAYQQLKLSSLPAGDYVIKIMNIADGCAQISPVISLTEVRTESGIEYSDNSLTFYPVLNGNTHLQSLSSSQF